ncbi:hypothetical protein RJZ90_005378 [Blastomyces dermatitidis]
MLINVKPLVEPCKSKRPPPLRSQDSGSAFTTPEAEANLGKPGVLAVERRSLAAKTNDEIGGKLLTKE